MKIISKIRGLSAHPTTLRAVLALGGLISMLLAAGADLKWT